MTYPPQGSWPDPQGGWQQSPPGGWQQSPPSGWQDPAGGYVDPASGQPAYVDPISGQPAAYPSYTTQAPVPTYPVSPEYGYQPATYPGYGVPMMAPTSRTNGMAIASMVLSLVGLLTFWCYGVPGLAFGAIGAIMGHVGKRQTTERSEQGGGMALAGIIMGWIAVLLGLITLGLVVWAFWWATNRNPYSTY
jgi:Domain of unknown function (DUF4190)